MMKKRITFSTLGCKVNQFESAAFATAFQALGHELVSLQESADICVINTCAVTGRAAQQSRQGIRRLRRLQPQALIVATGCWVQMVAAKAAELCSPPLLLVGNGHKDELVNAALAEESAPVLRNLVDGMSQHKRIAHLQAAYFPGRSRACLRVQDGCNNFCSYCIVPYTRGQSRSLPLADVLRQAEIFIGQGYGELIVTGINVGKYGLDLAEGETIYSLLDRLCCAFPQARIRLSSIELTEVNERLFSLLSEQTNLMPHLHIPLQSGDDTVLARMRRRYSRNDCLRTLTKLHSLHPQVSIGCDILTGFPGETKAEAENTRSLLADLPIHYLHIFPYSQRECTVAATLRDQVPANIKAARVCQLHELDSQKRRQWHKAALGQTHRVLFENQRKKDGLLQGFSGNYLPVLCAGPVACLGQEFLVQLSAMWEERIIGLLLNAGLEKNSANR